MLSSRNFSRLMIFVLIFLLMLNLTGMTIFSQTITLKYSDSDPPGGMRTDFLKEVWLAEIVKQTDGKVKFQDFWGSALLGPAEALKGCMDSVTDMTMVFSDFYPKQLPAMQLFRLFPRSPEKWENISWVYKQAFEQIPLFKEELKRWNQKVLLITVGLPSGMAASYPIDGIEDIVGYKWRASSRWHLAILEEIGANVVSVPWNDVYMALSTGTIDGVLTNYDGLHMMKFYEAAPNILVGPQLWWATPFLMTINIDKWNSLPADVQEGIMEASRITEEKFGEVFANAIESTIQEQRDYGCTVKIMDEDDVAMLSNEDAFSRYRNIWIKEAKEEFGIKDAAYIVNRLKLIIEEGIAREAK